MEDMYCCEKGVVEVFVSSGVDPSGTRTDLEYVDPELRLVGVAPGSARGANHVHVWSRDEPWGLAS